MIVHQISNKFDYQNDPIYIYLDLSYIYNHENILYIFQCLYRIYIYEFILYNFQYFCCIYIYEFILYNFQYLRDIYNHDFMKCIIIKIHMNRYEYHFYTIICFFYKNIYENRIYMFLGLFPNKNIYGLMIYIYQSYLL